MSLRLIEVSVFDSDSILCSCGGAAQDSGHHRELRGRVVRDLDRRQRLHVRVRLLHAASVRGERGDIGSARVDHERDRGVYIYIHIVLVGNLGIKNA